VPESRGRIDLAEIGDIVILIVILAAGAFAVPGGAGGGSGARNFPVFGAVTGNFSFSGGFPAILASFSGFISECCR